MSSSSRSDRSSPRKKQKFHGLYRSAAAAKRACDDEMASDKITVLKDADDDEKPPAVEGITTASSKSSVFSCHRRDIDCINDDTSDEEMLSMRRIFRLLVCNLISVSTGQRLLK